MVAATAIMDFRTLLALTVCNARVTCERFFILLMRTRISRADVMYLRPSDYFQDELKTCMDSFNFDSVSFVIFFSLSISLPSSGLEAAKYFNNPA